MCCLSLCRRAGTGGTHRTPRGMSMGMCVSGVERGEEGLLHLVEEHRVWAGECGGWTSRGGGRQDVVNGARRFFGCTLAARMGVVRGPGAEAHAGNGRARNSTPKLPTQSALYEHGRDGFRVLGFGFHPEPVKP